jgi:biopolymer transport protein ExbB/TolQ
MEAIATEGARHIFSQAGVIGVLLILSLVANAFFYKEILKCAHARIEDTRALLKALEDTAKVITASTLALEGNNRAMELRAAATNAVAAEVKELRVAIAFNEERTKALIEAATRDVVNDLEAMKGAIAGIANDVQRLCGGDRR